MIQENGLVIKLWNNNSSRRSLSNWFPLSKYCFLVDLTNISPEERCNLNFKEDSGVILGDRKFRGNLQITEHITFPLAFPNRTGERNKG
jgi:hypothetical protein